MLDMAEDMKFKEFNLNNFLEELHEWQESIDEDLKQNPYNMTCLCVRDVLGTVHDMIYDNIAWEFD